MAPPGGRESADLSALLFREPHRFDFFQAVRLLELAARERGGAAEGRRTGTVGGDHLPDQEGVRFRTLPSLAFPPASVAQVRKPRSWSPARGEPPVEVVVTFLGLVGANGVLPHHYTALLLRRLRDKDYSLRDFLDLFHHRMVSHFYRAWEKYRLPFAYERSRRDPQAPEDQACRALYSLVGMGTGGLRGRLEVADEALLYYSGHFAHYPRSAQALEGLLEDYFGVRVEVQQLHGQWLSLSEADRSRLGGPGGDEKPNNRPGVDLVVGRRVWDVQSKFRVRVGPVTYADFRRLMPNGDRLRALVQLTRTYAGPELDFDVQPVLKAAEVPWCQLGAGPERSCLGWNTWVRSGPMSRDVDDATFALPGL